MDDSGGTIERGWEAKIEAGVPVSMDEVSARYRGALDGFDLSEAEADEMIRMLWVMLVQIAALHLGIDPLQIIIGDHETGSEDANKVNSLLCKDTSQDLRGSFAGAGEEEAVNETS